MITRFPSKTNSLAHLKSFLNDEIRTIIDIGVNISTVELMKVFGGQKHVLVEPLEEYKDVIEENYTEAGIDFDLRLVAASSSRGQQKLRKISHLPEFASKFGGVTASDLVFDEKDDNPDLVTVETDTIDNIKQGYEGPFLVKIDVDGAEFHVLDGMTDCDDIFVVVVESHIPRMADFQRVMEEKGFVLFDITSLCYLRGYLQNVDLVFVNKALVENAAYEEISPRHFGHTSGEPGNYVQFSEELVSRPGNFVRYTGISSTGRVDAAEGDAAVASFATAIAERDAARAERDRAMRYPWKYFGHAARLRWGRRDRDPG